jgi:heptosyltransferase-2
MFKSTFSTPSPPQRIVVLRYRFIGDTVLMLPFLEALRQQYPHAVIDVVVSQHSGEILTHCPWINNLIFYCKKSENTPEKHAENTCYIKGFQALVQHLKTQHYNWAFVLKRSLSSAVIPSLAGIPIRIGFNTEYRSVLLTHPLPYPETGHEVEAFLSVLAGVGIPTPETPKLSAWIDPTTETTVTDRFSPYAQGAIHIGLHAVASNISKSWPTHRWQGLLALLIAQVEAKGLSSTAVFFHVFGTKADAEAYMPMLASLPPNWQPQWVDWCGKTDLLATQALLKRMTVLVGVDSGLLHLAGAVGTPVVGLYGAQPVARWGVWGQTHAVPEMVEHRLLFLGLGCQPCGLKQPCRNSFQCLGSLSQQWVLEAVAACKKSLDIKLKQ